MYTSPTDKGRLEVIAGCMFSGKSEELMRRLTRAAIARQVVVAFKPAIDDRYSVEFIESHVGARFPAIPLDDPKDMLDKVEDAQVIGIDEAQFFGDELLEVVMALVEREKRVIVAGLDLDWKGEPFGQMPELMARAEVVDKTYAVCMVCGAPASKSQRIVIDNTDTVLVGGSETYEARCREHWSPKGGTVWQS